MYVKNMAVIILSLFLGLSSLAYGEEYLELTISTAKGEGKVLIKLLPELAPKHVERIKLLTKDGVYNKVAFHRVIEGFMAQTGDVEFGNIDRFDKLRVGTGDSKYPNVAAEFSDRPFSPGVVGMARSHNVNSANSQFFIMINRHDSLNGKYTVIGEVAEGMDVIQNIKRGVSQLNGKVDDPDYIVAASIIEKESEAKDKSATAQ